jgi:hypothetical protein
MGCAAACRRRAVAAALRRYNELRADPMTLPVFILVAVVLPIALVAALWALVRSAIWSALRPRTFGAIQVAFGLIYLIVFWFIEPTTGVHLILSTILGAAFIAMGIYNWFRGQPQSLE